MDKKEVRVCAMLRVLKHFDELQAAILETGTGRENINTI